MNIARKLCSIPNSYVSRNIYRKFRISSINCESSAQTQPQIKEEKFNFEDLNVLERVERRKPKIPPFMKDVFLSVFNRDILAYPEILNKEETEAMESKVEALRTVFSDPQKTLEDKKNILKVTKMYAAPVRLTNNGLAANNTELLRYLEAIAEDFDLGQEISDHWVGLTALQQGLTPEQFNMIVDDLIAGEHTVSLGIKEKMAERLTQPDFRSRAEMDGQGVWRINGEKICQYSGGYILVLAAVEASRLKAFLVHPKTSGVEVKGNCVTFFNVPGTPLDLSTEQSLAQALGLSRLHAAVLSRCSLGKAVAYVAQHTRSRAYGGKPLSELSTIRSALGEALLHMYASESSEYLAAALLDAHAEPDAELEVAMCRNFISNRGLSTMLQLLLIPSLEQEQQCRQFLQHMQHLATRGESAHSVNMFIALTGIQHAGKQMSEEVKQMRNPLLNPGFIFKKVFADRLQEKDDPKLNLYLSEHLHPTLKLPSEQLEYCVLRMRYACETLMARHGADVTHAATELNRLAEAATDILAMTAVLARASRSYCIGLRNAEIEMKLAACFVEKTRDRVRKLIKEIDDGEYLNADHFTIQFGKKILENNTMLVEKPTARVFW